MVNRNSIKKIKFFFFLFLFLLSSIFILSNYYPGKNLNSQIPGDIKNPKTSDYWELTNTIYIDDSDPDFNWSKSENDYDYISGSGTYGDPYLIENVTINVYNVSSCIVIKNSNVSFIINNCTLLNSSNGVLDGGINMFNVNNSLISNNYVYDNYNKGISITGGVNNTIINNIVSNNSLIGIFINGENNTIENNLVEKSYNNIHFILSNNLILEDNYVYNASNYGLLLERTNNSYINNLTFEDNTFSIWNFMCSNNSFYEITTSETGTAEIGIDFSYNISIYDSYIVSSALAGIFINNSAFIHLERNSIGFQTYALYFHSNSNNITIFNNTLGYSNIIFYIFNPTVIDSLFWLNQIINIPLFSAIDNGVNNDFDNGTIGNYWVNYGGVDLDDNGIGDTPYNIGGSGGNDDDYPIWSDGDDLPPNITIINPIENETFGAISPNFTITVFDPSGISKIWYSINGGLTNITITENGTIDQILWDNISNNTLVTIIFWSNDTLGHLSNNTIEIYKIILIPPEEEEPEEEPEEEEKLKTITPGLLIFMFTLLGLFFWVKLAYIGKKGKKKSKKKSKIKKKGGKYE